MKGNGSETVRFLITVNTLIYMYYVGRFNTPLLNIETLYFFCYQSHMMMDRMGPILWLRGFPEKKRKNMMH